MNLYYIKLKTHKGKPIIDNLLHVFDWFKENEIHYLKSDTNSTFCCVMDIMDYKDFKNTFRGKYFACILMWDDAYDLLETFELKSE